MLKFFHSLKPKIKPFNLKMQNDIYIRRVTGSFGCPEKTTCELFKFINDKLEQFPSRSDWGEIDYIAVPPKTKLNQDDFIAFMAFKNRFVHLNVVNELKEIQPIDFKNRGMFFELNHRPTSIENQIENRNRFKRILQNEKKQKNELENEWEPVDYGYVEEETCKRQKTEKTLTDLLNEQIPIFLSQARENSERMKNTGYRLSARPSQSSSSVQKTVDYIPLVMDSKQEQEKQIKALELRNKALENRVMELELELAEKTMAIEKLERERKQVKEHYTAGLELFEH